MNIYKVAQRYERIIRQASSYADLVDIHEMAQSLAMDPYEELNPEEAGVAIEIAKLTAALADRAYRSGLSANELKWSADKIKNKLLQYGTNPELESIQDTLGAILSKLQGLSVSDIPAQGGGSTYKMQPGMETEEIELEEDQILSESPKSSSGLSSELRQTIDDLVDHRGYEDELQSFHDEKVISPTKSR